jgi:sulfur carrier protein ThiS
MGTKEQIDDIREKVLKGLKKTYENLLEMKRRNNSVIVVSENGQIIKIKPEKK